MANNKNNGTGALVAEVGAGIAAAAAAAGAGYYFYASDDAKKHRKAAAAWAKDLKNDVVKEAKRLGKDIDADTIAGAVDSALTAYQSVRSINRNDLDQAAEELKRNWKFVQQEALSQGKQAAKRGKAVAKRAGSSVKKASSRIAARGRSAAKKGAAKGRTAAKKAGKKAVKKVTAARKKARR